MKLCIRVVAAGAAGQDRAAALACEDGHILVLADGAGGRSGGAAAADAVLAGARALPRQVALIDCVELLQLLDQQLVTIGETTAVIAVIAAGQVMGASAGDSGAWLIGSSSLFELTENQQRKPLLGTGNAIPIKFERQPLTGRLLLASDGLLKYVPQARICELIRTLPIEEVGAALIEAARLPSGALWDDVAIIVAGIV